MAKNTFRDTEGKEIKGDGKVARVVERWRDVYLGAKGSAMPDSVVDDDVYEAVTQVEGDDSDDKVFTARLEAVTALGDVSDDDADESSITATPDQDRLAAREIGALVPVELDQLITTTATKKEELDGCLVKVVHVIDNTPALAEKLDGGPLPKSRWDAEPGAVDHPGYYGDNDKSPDYYKRGKVTGNHFQDVYDGTPGGRWILDVPLAIIKRLDDNSEKKDYAERADDIRAWEGLVIKGYKELPWATVSSDPKKRTAARKRWKARRAFGAEKLRTAQQFRLVRARIQKHDHLKVELIDDDIETVHLFKSPIMLVEILDKAKPHKTNTSEPKSIGTIARIDVKRAEAAAKTAGKRLNIDMLQEAAKRVARPPDGSNAVSGTINDTKSLDTAVATGGAFMASLANKQLMLEYVAKMDDHQVKSWAAFDTQWELFFPLLNDRLVDIRRREASADPNAGTPQAAQSAELLARMLAERQKPAA